MITPSALPKCEHGRGDFHNCEKCRARDKEIREELQPLADEFWRELPKRNADLSHLLYRAYRMGMRHDNK